MEQAEILERLVAHRKLGDCPRHELEWLSRHGEVRTAAAGERIFEAGVYASHLMIHFKGRIRITAGRPGGQQTLFEWSEGEMGGALPYSRGARAPADVMVLEDSISLWVPKEDFPELTRECPEVTARLVHAMVDRARVFSANDLRDEKLVSLGRLAAGLAHELNNPAAAAVRSARLLDDALRAIEAAAARVGAAELSAAQRDVIERVRSRCFARLSGPLLSPLARADREEAIGDWLAAHGVSEECAAPLAETALSIGALDELAAVVSGDALDAALRWVAAGCLVRTLAQEIQMATSRIEGLVRAVKGFTFMDHARTAEPVALRQGLEDTFTILGSKVRGKAAEIILDLPADLPRVKAVGAELNQVWMNLCDNALDAIPPGGHITIEARAEGEKVVVRVRDDGGGIPADAIDRIFDPFYTTKEVGKGTGLGLDVTRRIVQRLESEIAVTSEPGRTEFIVRLPRAE